jgi:alpha-1,6-mannosyltransferase
MKRSSSRCADQDARSEGVPTEVGSAPPRPGWVPAAAPVMAAAYAVLPWLTLWGVASVWFLRCYILVALLAGVLWGGLLWQWRPGWFSPRGIVFWGVLFRVLLLPVPPLTSTDVFRYVWDGKVFVWTGNPYRCAPVSDELRSLRDGYVFPHINHPELPTIYPPLAQVLFAVAYLLGNDSLWGIKLLNLLAEGVTLWLLGFVRLAAVGRDASWIVAYAWCPLPILESMVGVHGDTLGMPWLAAVYLAAAGRRPVVAGLALAGAALIKLFPLVLLPALWRQERGRAVVAVSAASLLPLVAGWAAFFLDAADPLVSLRVYVWNWQFNAPLFSGFQHWLQDGYRARQICLLLFLATAAGVVIRETRFIPAAQWLWLAFFLCGTTVFPWYLMWLVPGLMAGFSFPVVWLIVTAPLTYFTELGYQVEGVWRESYWVWAVEFLPVTGWLVGRGGVRIWQWHGGRRHGES